MKDLIDNAISPSLSRHLKQAGHDCVHVRDYGLASAIDAVIFEKAAAEDRILISADTDFGTLLAERQASRPSVVLFRRTSGNRLLEFGLLSNSLLRSEICEALQRGSIVVIEPKRIRIRTLPIGGDAE